MDKANYGYNSNEQTQTMVSRGLGWGDEQDRAQKTNKQTNKQTNKKKTLGQRNYSV